MKKIHKKLWYFILVAGMVLPVLDPPAFNESAALPYIAPDTIIASLRSNQHGYLLFRGEPTGFQMELIRHFAQSMNKPFRIRIDTGLHNRWSELLNNDVNIIVSNSEDDSVLQVYKNELLVSVPIEETTRSVWVVTQHNRPLLTAINSWIHAYRTTTEYAIRRQAYFTRLNYPAKAPYTTLSAYDKLIKHYALQIGWDWRLLASLVYQESKFRPDAESHRGAYGLMQITPPTADFLKVDSIEEPEQNLEAGIQFIRYLQRNIEMDSVSQTDSIRFVLAAYNAGLNRLKDCRQFTQSQGKNPNSWTDVASVIPLMKLKIFYDSDDIELGYFRGLETLNYVDEVMNRYEHYKQLVSF